MATDWTHRPLADLINRVPDRSVNPFAVALERGQLYVELYCPVEADHQAPHARDECYFVVEGSGEFVCGEERVTVGPGDFLFVPAGMPHRFENFGHRLRTWVLFYGPEGGEQPT
jgi:mannose-6-phosphate isomerase-like protein (cupin superfamily)